MKKFMIIALLAIGFIVLTAPESNAGVSIGIGVGFPVYGYPDTTRMATVITRTATTPTARRITDRLSTIAACMGLIIGGMAIGCTFGGATSGIKGLNTFVNTV